MCMDGMVIGLMHAHQKAIMVLVSTVYVRTMSTKKKKKKKKKKKERKLSANGLHGPFLSDPFFGLEFIIKD